MKFFAVVLCALVAVVSCQEFCYNDVVASCGSKADSDLEHCDARYGGVHSVAFHLQSYVNDHIARSFDYLLMSTHFSNYQKNREGFSKLFRKLSDSTWDDAIDLIKYITKRGERMDFSARKGDAGVPDEKTHELFELHALARGLDTQKKLAEEAHLIHKEALKHHEGSHDPEVTSYLEEHFLHKQAENVREFSGYTNDLKRLLAEPKQSSLALFLFDEYLQKKL